MDILVLDTTNNLKADYGDVIQLRAYGFGMKPDELPTFCMLRTPDPMSSARAYAGQPWVKNIALSVVNSDLTTDTFVLALSCSNISSTLGALVLSDVQTFIQNWGGVIGTIATNSVQFSITAYDAATSINFWRCIDLAQYLKVKFSQVSYTQGTETTRIQANYLGLGANATTVEDIVEGLGAKIISHANQVIIYDITRATVQAHFTNAIQRGGAKIIKHFRYRIADALVLQAHTAPGKILVTDLATVQANLIDKQAL